MGTQYDSIDMSQMKVFALGLNKDQVSNPCTSNACRVGYAHKLTLFSLQSEHRDLPAVTTALRQHDERQVSTILPDGNHANAPNSQPHNTTHTQAGPGSQPQSRPPGLRARAQRFSASQPELPSTIAESSRSRMLSSGSQSQGDTQPVSQWVYEEFTNRSKGQRATRSRSEIDESTVIGGDDASHSIQQGQTGHIDLLGIFDHPSNIDADGPSQVHDDNDVDSSPQAPDVRADIFPKSKHSQQP